MNHLYPIPIPTSIDGVFTKKELDEFVKLHRTFNARRIYKVMPEAMREEYKRYMPKGRLLLSPEGVVLYFDPDPCEYPNPNSGGHLALRMASMRHAQRYAYCLTDRHIFNLFYHVRLDDFTRYHQALTEAVGSKRVDPFDPRLDQWIDKIAKDSAKTHTGD